MREVGIIYSSFSFLFRFAYIFERRTIPSFMTSYEECKELPLTSDHENIVFNN